MYWDVAKYLPGVREGGAGGREFGMETNYLSAWVVFSEYVKKNILFLISISTKLYFFYE